MTRMFADPRQRAPPTSPGPGLSRWVRLKSFVPDRLPYAAVLFVSVVGEGGHDQLFHCHRGCVREENPALRQLLVAEAADHSGCLGRPLAMERERLFFSVASELLRVLGIPFVEHLPREVAERLSSRESCGDVEYSFIRRRLVMRRHADGPLLYFCDLLPVRGGDSFEYMGGFQSLGLELPGDCFSLYSHGVLLGVGLIQWSNGKPRNRQGSRNGNRRRVVTVPLDVLALAASSSCWRAGPVPQRDSLVVTRRTAPSSLSWRAYARWFRRAPPS